MNPLVLLPALICYLAAATGFILDREGRDRRWTRIALGAFAVGIVAQAAVLIGSATEAGNMPVTNLVQSIDFLSWLTALAGLILILRFRMAVIGAFVAPLVLVATTIAVATMSRQNLRIPAALRSAWLPIHVTLAFAGFALFLLAASVSLVYLIFEHRLKAKRPLAPDDERAPSLEKLDRVNYRLLIWGFLMLSLAIVTGAIWADSTWGHFWSWEPQESWSLVIWLMYAALLESRLTAGWRGRRVAALTIVVFTLLIGSFVGIQLVTPGKHGGSFG
ncbi:MAG TPA: c-type cytochrome biogenesis protein CcsB [Candidatus Binataceae bacterium]|nr:c-type cytochrome biogenesis protein CcsB [Candidatus Binataceae bacterium]